MNHKYTYRGELMPFVGRKPSFAAAMEGAAMLVEFVTAGHSEMTAPDTTTIQKTDDHLIVEFVWDKDSTLRIKIDSHNDHTISVLSVLPHKGMAGEELGLLLCKMRPLLPKKVANSYRELDVEFEGA